jgi:hypothetical protein
VTDTNPLPDWIKVGAEVVTWSGYDDDKAARNAIEFDLRQAAYWWASIPNDENVTKLRDAILTAAPHLGLTVTPTTGQPAYIARVVDPARNDGQPVGFGGLSTAIGDGLRAAGYSYDRLVIRYQEQ